MLDWSNVEILARSAKDNPDAIEELYELMQPAILWQAKRMSAGGRITDELISRLNYAFMMAVNCYANESRTTCSFVNYLHHMMRSYAWNLRKQETKPLVNNSEGMFYQASMEDADMEAKIFGTFEDELLLNKIELEQFLSSLDERKRDFVESYMKGESLVSIGKRYGISKQAVWDGINKAVRRYVDGKAGPARSRNT